MRSLPNVPNIQSKIESTDRILIVGGSGFIGQHLARRCLELTPHVTSLGFQPNKNWIVPLPNLTAKQCDLQVPSSVAQALKGDSFHYVFNLGGYIDHTPYSEGGRRTIEQHLLGLLNLVDSVERSTLKRFVQVGSSDEYGDSPAPQSEDMRGSAISPYAFAKQSATDFVSMLAKHDKFPGVVTRPFLVYGPGQDRIRFLPHVITNCLQGKRFPVTPGHQQRDFCYVGDIVEAMLLAATVDGTEGCVINVASGVPVSLRQMIDLVVKLVGRGAPDYDARSYRSGENMALYADISKARALLNWSPATSLETGLRKTINYYEELAGA